MTFCVENSQVKKYLLEGEFGLEKESLRVLEDGSFSHTPHPFPNDAHIVKDFCENQTEINTGVHDSARGAIDELESHNQRIYDRLQSLPQKEYLWLFSNPPHIKNDSDIPIAIFEGAEAKNRTYREYLGAKYGRYRMTFSGIHVNFSFSEKLLEEDFACHAAKENQQKADRNTQNLEKADMQKSSDLSDGAFQEYKNRLYLDLAQGLAAYGWILVAVTAASPVLDGSYLEKGVYGQDVFSGMGSVRCSELGYWNEFAPVFDYTDIESYADGIQRYVDRGFLTAPRELYYPIRLKPPGENTQDSLRKNGVNHIELRMFDLNPLTRTGVEEKDILFAQLLMVWLASTPRRPLTDRQQVQAVQNFKNAARYDLKTVRMVNAQGETISVAKAAIEVIDQMKEFYRNLQIDVSDILDFEYAKFIDANNRYAWKIREWFGTNYAEKALKLAKERQDRSTYV